MITQAELTLLKKEGVTQEDLREATRRQTLKDTRWSKMRPLGILVQMGVIKLAKANEILSGQGEKEISDLEHLENLRASIYEPMAWPKKQR